MNEVYEKINSAESELGKLDINIITDSEVKFEYLYYYYPMIERIIRYLFYYTSIMNIENFKNQTMKTLKGILDDNKSDAEECLGKELFDDIYEIYSDDGNRNKVMHFRKNTTCKASDITKAKEVFDKLCVKYSEIL